MFGFGRKRLTTFKDYIFSALGRSRFHYSKTEMLVDSLASQLEGVTRERDFDRIIENSRIKDRLEEAEDLSCDDFENAVEQFKRDNRIR